MTAIRNGSRETAPARSRRDDSHSAHGLHALLGVGEPIRLFSALPNDATHAKERRSISHPHQKGRSIHLARTVLRGLVEEAEPRARRQWADLPVRAASQRPQTDGSGFGARGPSGPVGASSGLRAAYSITSSARATNEGPTSMPRARAVCRFTANSNSAVRSIGIVAGDWPRSTCASFPAAIW
jgi:hypothetical protein